MVRAGRYRHLLTFWRPNTAIPADSYSEPSDLMELIATRYAALNAWTGFSGEELNDAGRQWSLVTHVIECRFFPDLAADCIAKKGSRTFQVLWYKDIEERKREMHIYVKEIQNASQFQD